MALHDHGIDSPFKDALTPVPDKNDSSNRSLDKTPGYKAKDDSPNAPSVTHRHSNMDGGANPGGTAEASPDMVKKRA